MKDQLDTHKIMETIKGVLQLDEGASVALHEPLFAGNEKAYVNDCIDSTYVSSVGKYVDKFEEMLADYTGVEKAVVVVNGTAALHICLKLSGVEQDDEVIVPALTFVATANAVTYCGAVPHFVDIEEQTLGLDPRKLEEYLGEIAVLKSGQCFNNNTGRPIKAVIAMHTFGHPVDLDPLIEVCKRYNIILVEDAAESLGSLHKGKHTGNWGKLTALSFNGNKIITTGGGGAILTNDQELGKLAKHITTTAKIPHKWEYIHDQVGYNYRLPNINAALGCAQMEQLPAFVEKKRSLAVAYQKAFEGLDGLHIFNEPQFARSNYWLNVLLIDDEFSSQRDELLEITNSNGIITRPAWKLMPDLPMFKDCPKMELAVARSIEKRLINLPSSVFLAGTEVCGKDG